MRTKHNHINVITSTSEWGCAVLHRGIGFEQDGKKYILHMTFSGPELTTPEKFSRKRKVLSIKKYSLQKDLVISDIINNPKYQRFKLLTCNCETFVNDIVNEYTTGKRMRASQQVVFWIIVITLILLNNKFFIHK